MTHNSPHQHAHAEVAIAANFDDDWYQESPRTGLVAMSSFGTILSHTGSYNSLGTPDAEIELDPMTGDIIAFVYELWGSVAGTGKIKFYAFDGVSTRVILGAEQTTAGTIDPPIPFRLLVNLNSVGALGDLRGESFILEVYLEHTAGDAKARHLRVYGGTEGFSSAYLR